MDVNKINKTLMALLRVPPSVSNQSYTDAVLTVSIPMIQLFPATSILKMNDVNYRPKLHYHQLNELMLISTNGTPTK